jgi:hypothetical protein
VHPFAEQASVVQASLSLQSAAVWQQPVRAGCEHVFEAHVSTVHGLPSSQKMSGMGVAVSFSQHPLILA